MMNYKKIIFVITSLIFIINLQFTFAQAIKEYMQANNSVYIYGAPVDVGRNAYVDWDNFTPDIKYRASLVYKGYTNEIIVTCHEPEKKCWQVEGDLQEKVPYRAPKTTNKNIQKVDFFDPRCVEKGFIPVKGYPFTYKCTDDKTGYFVCYKSGSGIYTEPNPYPFKQPLETNKLRKAICNLSSPNLECSPVTDTEPIEVCKIIPNAEVNPILIDTIKVAPVLIERNINIRDPTIVNQTTERNNDPINIGQTNLEFPHFIINSDNITPFTSRDINIGIPLKDNTFNIEDDIYMLIVDDKGYENIISEINNFVNTDNSEYITSNFENNKPIKYKLVNNTIKIKHIYSNTNNKVINLVLDRENFVDGVNRKNKFVFFLLQKTENKLNIAYANIFVLNNDELLSYSQCELSRRLLSFFCNPIDSRCKEIKNCYNGYLLNFDAIDLKGFIYSKTKEQPTTQEPTVIIPQQPVTEVSNKTTPSQDVLETTDVDKDKYYSTQFNTGDQCSNAKLTTNQWGCVCIIQRSGAKRVVPAKCSSKYGLILYGTPHKSEVPTQYQTCYNEPSTKCR